MARELPGKCPVCGAKMDVTELHCPHCEITISGRFDLCKFCALDPQMKEFVEIFIKCRGNIKEVERELGISYPTVRNRLDKVIEALGYNVDDRDWQQAADERKMILAKVSRGELNADEAAKLLKQFR